MTSGSLSDTHSCIYFAIRCEKHPDKVVCSICGEHCGEYDKDRPYIAVGVTGCPCKLGDE